MLTASCLEVLSSVGTYVWYFWVGSSLGVKLVGRRSRQTLWSNSCLCVSDARRPSVLVLYRSRLAHSLFAAFACAFPGSRARSQSTSVIHPPNFICLSLAILSRSRSRSSPHPTYHYSYPHLLHCVTLNPMPPHHYLGLFPSPCANRSLQDLRAWRISVSSSLRARTLFFLLHITC